MRAIHAVTRGPSFWKLNASLLERPGFQKLIRKTISEFVSSKHLYPSLQYWWDMLKLSIQLHAKELSKNHAKQRRSTISKLENDLLQVNETLASQPEDENLLSCRARLDLTLGTFGPTLPL
jgi:hypothetical protein